MRVRKHANPFSVRVELGRLDLPGMFGREAPLEIELGSGAGGFLLDRAKANRDADFIGFEIREPLVIRANRQARELGLENVVFLYANSSTNLENLVEPGTVRRFHVHFPDPCFKKRHWKRRILQPFIVRHMARLLTMGGDVYAQTDVRPLAEEMYDFLAAESALEGRLPAEMTVPSPIAEKTEWERQHEAEGEPIYRMLFEKVRPPQGPVPELEMRETQPHSRRNQA
jgi:tRNA (guanine-N7-)-methyltransferase